MKKCFCYYEVFNPECQIHTSAGHLMGTLERLKKKPKLYKREPIKKPTEADKVRQEGRF